MPSRRRQHERMRPRPAVAPPTFAAALEACLHCSAPGVRLGLRRLILHMRRRVTPHAAALADLPQQPELAEKAAVRGGKPLPAALFGGLGGPGTPPALPSAIMSAAEAQAVLANPANFEALVAQLLVADNEARKHAEAVFEQLKTQPNGCIQHLLRCLRQSPNEENRAFCAIMLRKVRGQQTRGRPAPPHAGRPDLIRPP